MAWSNLTGNQMVSENDSNTGGFNLNANQLYPKTNKMMTKAEAFTIYNLAVTSNTNSIANNQLMQKSFWGSATDTTAPTVPPTPTYYPGNASPYIDIDGDGVSDSGWGWSPGSTDNVGVSNYEIVISKNGTFLLSEIVFSEQTFYKIGNGFPSYFISTYGAGNYCFKVRAKDSAGNWSAFSAESCVSLAQASDTTPPTTPVLSPIANFGVPRLTWSTSTDDSGINCYEIWRDTNSSGIYNYMDSVGFSPWDDVGAVSGNTYLYKVRAMDNAGNFSAFSNIRGLSF